MDVVLEVLAGFAIELAMRVVDVDRIALGLTEAQGAGKQQTALFSTYRLANTDSRAQARGLVERARRG